MRAKTSLPPIVQTGQHLEDKQFSPSRTPGETRDQGVGNHRERTSGQLWREDLNIAKYENSRNEIPSTHHHLNKLEEYEEKYSAKLESDNCERNVLPVHPHELLRHNHITPSNEPEHVAPSKERRPDYAFLSDVERDYEDKSYAIERERARQHSLKVHKHPSVHIVTVHSDVLPDEDSVKLEAPTLVNYFDHCVNLRVLVLSVFVLVAVALIVW